jgi:hypothetical protein
MQTDGRPQQEAMQQVAPPPSVIEVVIAPEETATNTTEAPSGDCGSGGGDAALHAMMMMNMSPPPTTGPLSSVPVATPQQMLLAGSGASTIQPPYVFAPFSNIPHSVQVPAYGVFAAATASPSPLLPPAPPENTIYVNRHQYQRILQRRESRRVLDAYYERCRHGKKRTHPNYKHESRHRHAQNRPRNRKGHFMKGPELEEYYHNNPDKVPANYKHQENKSSSATGDGESSSSSDDAAAAAATQADGKTAP